ncbi:MAG TPA: hypothetical protein VFC39_14125, partial [Acidobacteriaceae bacterium]|nr:hypothetical protein [Acidobacteriaceae bacterium]
VRIVVLGCGGGVLDCGAADAYLPVGAQSAAGMLARLHLLTARKRGPKAEKKPVASVGADAVRREA